MLVVALARWSVCVRPLTWVGAADRPGDAAMTAEVRRRLNRATLVWAKTCSMRALTLRSEALGSPFQHGSSAQPGTRW